MGVEMTRSATCSNKIHHLQYCVGLGDDADPSGLPEFTYAAYTISSGGREFTPRDRCPRAPERGTAEIGFDIPPLGRGDVPLASLASRRIAVAISRSMLKRK
jgi:hypothetical protein